jgi:hypothetical protein
MHVMNFTEAACNIKIPGERGCVGILEKRDVTKPGF